MIVKIDNLKEKIGQFLSANTEIMKAWMNTSYSIFVCVWFVGLTKS